jgi:Ca2+-binding EF-hand superfamily protein
MGRIRTALLAVSLALGAVAALAEQTPNTHDPRQAYAEADRNRDGRIDREEFHQRMVEIFFHGDRDKDGYMTQAELEATVVFPEDFKAADRDENGRISLHEFMRVRFYTFDEVDLDRDGALSVEEVVGAYEGKKAK